MVRGTGGASAGDASGLTGRRQDRWQSDLRPEFIYEPSHVGPLFRREPIEPQFESLGRDVTSIADAQIGVGSRARAACRIARCEHAERRACGRRMRECRRMSTPVQLVDWAHNHLEITAPNPPIGLAADLNFSQVHRSPPALQ